MDGLTVLATEVDPVVQHSEGETGLLGGLKLDMMNLALVIAHQHIHLAIRNLRLFGGKLFGDSAATEPAAQDSFARAPEPDLGQGVFRFRHALLA